MSTQAITASGGWLLLVHQLPPRPTNLRVAIWRKLQRLGAVAIKNSVYVLPANEKTNEDFQWLKQQIESARGGVLVFRADSVEGATDEEIIELFRKARDDEFSSLAAELDGLAGALREQMKGKHLSAGRLAAHEAELNKLHLELERVTAIDFFNARNRGVAHKAFERCRKAIQSGHAPQKDAQTGSTRRGVLALSQFQGRRWVTRRNLHIDRLASAWLIKQFIDKRPRFHFVSEGESIEGAIAFDMYGAEFSHHGDDCTFETMIKRFNLAHIKGLRELGQIVHDIDLKDEKFHRLEAQGLNAVITGLSQALRDDGKLLKEASVIFDGLFLVLGSEADASKTRRTGRERKRKSKTE